MILSNGNASTSHGATQERSETKPDHRAVQWGFGIQRVE